MQTTSHRRHATLFTSAEIKPDQIPDEGWRGGMMRPRYVAVNYVWRPDRDRWEIHSIRISGPRVLKSGALGTSTSNEYAFNWEVSAPDWARKWAESNRPTAVPYPPRDARDLIAQVGL